jgi:glycosyltransferase involved in cell wall biosynthesis
VNMIFPSNSFVTTGNSDQKLSHYLKDLVGLASQANRPCMLCLRIHIDRKELEWILSQSYVVSVILESEFPELGFAFPGRVGHYVEGGSALHFPLKIAREMIYVGAWADFGTRVAWQAWHAGVRRIHVVSRFQTNEARSLIQVVIRKACVSLISRFLQSSGGNKLGASVLTAFRFQEFCFGRRLRTIKRLPVPIACLSNDCVPSRIIMVGGTLGPGGAERQLTATLLGLFSFGHRDVHFLHHSPMHKPNDFFLPQLIEAGIPFSQVDLNGGGNSMSHVIAAELERRLAPLGDLGNEVIAYAQEFLSRRPEVVHVWLDQMNVVAGLAAVLVGVPRIVLSCRSLSPTHFAFNQPYMRPIYRILASYPNVIFLNNSKAGAKDYMRWLSVKDLTIRVVQNGFDFTSLPSPQKLLQLRREIRRLFGIPETAPVLGVIMRISEEKRPLLWIEIARQVAFHSPDSHFLIIGDGPMRGQVEAIAKANLGKKIHFKGHMQHTTMAFAAMDIFMLTSRVEGLPNVLIESQAHGVPPLTLDVGGASETLEDKKTGWIIKSEDPQIIADKIKEILLDKESLKNVARNGPKYARKNFSCSQMINETISVYKICL